MRLAQSWSRRHHWFEPTSSLSIFKGLYLVNNKTLALIFPVQLKEKNYINAKIQAEICMFTQQNRPGLNRPILRPLLLMTGTGHPTVYGPCEQDIICQGYQHDNAIKWKYFPRYWPYVWEISLPKASDAEHWCFLWSASEQTVEQTIARLGIWYPIVSIMTAL